MVTKEVYAVATTDDGTRLAMCTAQQIATSEGGSVVVIVPHVVPFGVELDRCGHDLTGLAEPYRAMVLEGHADTTIRVCACREPGQVSKLLGDQAQVVVAGRRGRWRLTRAERLAQALELAGHHVVFVDVAVAHTDPDAPGSLSRPPVSTKGILTWTEDSSAPLDGVRGLFRRLSA